MATETVTAAEIQAAGGLAKWMRKAESEPRREASPSVAARDQFRDATKKVGAPHGVPAHQPGRMNRWERRYADEVLTPRLRAGEIESFEFEALKLNLGHRCWYTPDFVVWTTADIIEFHEVKGFWRDDARVKIKAAARRYPWATFLAATIKQGAWKWENIQA